LRLAKRQSQLLQGELGFVLIVQFDLATDARFPSVRVAHLPPVDHICQHENSKRFDPHVDIQTQVNLGDVVPVSVVTLIT
jgi:hypothetical protein